MFPLECFCGLYDSKINASVQSAMLYCEEKTESERGKIC